LTRWRYLVAAISVLICLYGAGLAFSNGDYVPALAFLAIAVVFAGWLLVLIRARERRGYGMLAWYRRRQRP
jgi:hypothetical protein